MTDSDSDSRLGKQYRGDAHMHCKCKMQLSSIPGLCLSDRFEAGASLHTCMGHIHDSSTMSLHHMPTSEQAHWEMAYNGLEDRLSGGLSILSVRHRYPDGSMLRGYVCIDIMTLQEEGPVAAAAAGSAVAMLRWRTKPLPAGKIAVGLQASNHCS